MSRYDDFTGEHFRTALARDFAGHFIGDMIGEGQFRKVFVWEPARKTQVVKTEDKYGSFHNITEHQVWQEVKDRPIAKWFAPCIAISGSGILLWQARTTPVKGLHELPKRVPRFFTDLKPSNWGWYRGRVVCHDYGLNNLIRDGLTCGMRTADWR